MSPDHPCMNGSYQQPPAAPPEVADDAGSQALADALKRSFAIVKVIMGGLVVLFLFSGFFTVGPQQKAIILRFGTPVGGGKLYGPGAHWAFPPPIDEVIKMPVGQVQSVESSIGWYATTAAGEAAKQEPPPLESLPCSRRLSAHGGREHRSRPRHVALPHR